MLYEQRLLTKQQTRPEARGLSPHTLGRVLDYIQEHLAQTLTQAEIAAMVYISPYHFARQFRRATGQSLHQYIIIQRLEKAAQMLLAGPYTIAEIALQVGFTDQSHLYRHFKRYFGVTPRTFVARRTNVQLESTNIQELQADIN